MPKLDQTSREYGVKLAKALIQYAGDAAQKEPAMDQRSIVVGATEYLERRVEVWRNPPIDPSLGSADDVN